MYIYYEPEKSIGRNTQQSETCNFISSLKTYIRNVLASEHLANN